MAKVFEPEHFGEGTESVFVSPRWTMTAKCLLRKDLNHRLSDQQRPKVNLAASRPKNVLKCVKMEQSWNENKHVSTQSSHASSYSNNQRLFCCAIFMVLVGLNIAETLKNSG